MLCAFHHTAKSSKLKALTTSQDADLQNPLLTCMAGLLKDSLADARSRGILFCKTRATAKALHAWLEATADLKFLQAGILTGSKGSEGIHTFHSNCSNVFHISSDCAMGDKTHVTTAAVE